MQRQGALLKSALRYPRQPPGHLSLGLTISALPTHLLSTGSLSLSIGPHAVPQGAGCGLGKDQTGVGSVL
uniref:Uncharacterized protein n=1 Tax=Babesia bovis TaxID=5865 RepID=S6B3L0_BABBO|nr:hypothetical protein [Babesia bovis]